MGKFAWKLLSLAAAAGAAVVARKLTDGTWKFVTGAESPQNPEDPEIDFKEAIAFALVSGSVIALARLVANRQATQLWKRSTGQLPPGMEEKKGSK